MRNYLLLIFLLFAFVYGCKEDDFLLTEEGNPHQGNISSQPLYDWNEWEEHFFQLAEPPYDQSVGSRNAPSTYAMHYHPLLMQVYEKLAELNEQHNFIPDIAEHVGFPHWEHSFVFYAQNESNLVIIPLSLPDDNETSALIISQVQESTGEYIFNAVTRDTLLSMPITDAEAYLSYLEAFIKYDKKLFGVDNSTLKDTYDAWLQAGVVADGTIDLHSGSGQVDSRDGGCVWRQLQICYVSEDEQEWWIGGIENTPLHLDHDRDGILNSEDQDWSDFLQRYGIDESEFEDIVRMYWEAHLQEQYGDYDMFWQESIDYWQNEYYLELEEFWEYWHIDGHFWDWFEDEYEPIPPQTHYAWSYDDWWWDDGWWWGLMGSSELASRSEIICSWYYVLDCNNGACCGWLEAFDQLISCDNCDEQDLSHEDQMKAARMSSYIDKFGLNSFESLLSSNLEDACAFCPEKVTYDYFTEVIVDYIESSFSEVTFSSSQKQVFLTFPEILDEIYEYLYLYNEPQMGGITQEVLDNVDYLINGVPYLTEAYEKFTAGGGLNGEVPELFEIIERVTESGHGELVDDFIREHQGEQEVLTSILSVLNLIEDGLLNGPYNEAEREQIQQEYYGSIEEAQHFATWCVILVNEWIESHPGEVCETSCKVGIALKAMWRTKSGRVHTFLDLCGLIPAAGEACDGINGILYTIEGDGVNAALSFAAMVPLVGWAATGGKYVKYALKVGGETKILKNSVDLAGQIKFSHSGRLREMLGIKGNPAFDDFQAHHIIPEQLQLHPAVQKAAKSGEDNIFMLNHPKNGVPIHKSQHSGSHPNYTNQVRDFLDEIDYENLPAEEVAEIIHTKLGEWKNFLEISAEHINALNLP